MMNQDYTISVTKFNTIIRDIFNAEELLHNIKIVGEVFGISISKTSTYFSVKDENSSLPCVCFYGDLMRDIKEGDSVIITGSPNFYAKSGRFNFVVNRVEPYGLGVLYQRFLQLKEQLQKEGLFDESHKKAIPETIKRIGVVTSKDGAVIQDIKNVCWRRNPGIDIVLYNTKVQGNDAEKEIAQGIDFFSEYEKVDVVVVARGGGSLEDLSAYNTEIVARATYACKKPIISAVGHETDFTIIDFVSDLRAPTPSAAAELLTKDTKGLKNSLRRDCTRLSRLLENYLTENTFHFQELKNSIISFTEDIVEIQKYKLEKLVGQLQNKLTTFATEKDYQLKLKLAKLEKLNPLDILKLGYAKIEQGGKVVSNLVDVDLNKELCVNFADGKVIAKPIKKE